MSKLPDWAERIASIRAALSNITTQVIDRRQIGELFGVSPNQAGCLIHDMGPIRHGNSLVVDAEDIRKMLSEIERDQEVRDLLRRLAEKDAEIERVLQRQKTAGRASRQLADLASGKHLEQAEWRDPGPEIQQW